MCVIVSKAFVVGVGAWVPLVVLVAACAPSGGELRRELLFAPDGTERVRPVEDLEQRLVKASHETRLSLISRLAWVLRTKGGYSRVVAARGLMGFLDQHLQYYNAEVASAVADSLVELVPDDAEALPYVIAVERFMDGNWALPADLEVRLLPRYSMWWEHREYWVYPGASLPYGWRAYDGAVYVDGRAVMHHPQAYEMKGGFARAVMHHPQAYEMKGGFAQFPEEKCDLRKALLTRKDGKAVTAEELVGTHEIESRLKVIAPDGTEIPLKHKVILRLVFELQLRID